MTPPLVIGGVCAMGLIGALPGCGHAVVENAFPLAAVHLTCWPVERGVHCQLLALSRDVSQAPRDVTREASWHLSGVIAAHISTTGIVEASREGDVGIDVNYQSRTAHCMVRLRGNRPGKLLAILRGHAFAEDDGSLEPVAGVRLEVVSGPDAGKSATTKRDGGYELAGLLPGTLELRATRPGYESSELAVSIKPGDAHVNVLVRALIRRDGGPPGIVGASVTSWRRPRAVGLAHVAVAVAAADDCWVGKAPWADAPSVWDANRTGGPPHAST